MSGLKSEVWKYFEQRGNGQVKCKICRVVFSYGKTSSTGNLRRHLRLKHILVLTSLRKVDRNSPTPVSDSSLDLEQSIQLIEMYKNYKILWNSEDMDYYNRNKREDAWEEISTALQVPVPTVKAKMKSLVMTYRSEKSKEKKSRITGKVYKSKWFAFKYFNFLSDDDNEWEALDPLNEFTEPRKQEQEDEEEEGQVTVTLPSFFSDTSAATSRKSAFFTPITSGPHVWKKTALKSKKGNEGQKLKILNHGILQSSTDGLHDPHFMYGQYVASELRKYDAQTLAHVKRAISNILFEADTGRLVYKDMVQPSLSPSATTTGHSRPTTPSSVPLGENTVLQQLPSMSSEECHQSKDNFIKVYVENTMLQ